MSTEGSNNANQHVIDRLVSVVQQAVRHNANDNESEEDFASVLSSTRAQLRGRRRSTRPGSVVVILYFIVCFYQCRINANRVPWQVFVRGPFPFIEELLDSRSVKKRGKTKRSLLSCCCSHTEASTFH
jgi:hypothetical protein